MYRRGNARSPLADFSIRFKTAARGERKRKRLTSLSCLRIFSRFEREAQQRSAHGGGSGEGGGEGARRPCSLLRNCKNRPQGVLGGGGGGGGHASPSSSFSEIEFGRAGPTSPLHSSIHLVIPSGGGGRKEVPEWEGRWGGGGSKEGGTECKSMEVAERGEGLEERGNFRSSGLERGPVGFVLQDKGQIWQPPARYRRLVSLNRRGVLLSCRR